MHPLNGPGGLGEGRQGLFMRYLLVTLLTLLSVQAGLAEPVLTPQSADAMAMADFDQSRLSPEDQYDTRYIWFQEQEPKLQWARWAACSGQVNFLSTRSRKATPLAVVLKDGTVKPMPEQADFGKLALMRVRLSDYNFSPEQWEKLGDPTLEPLFRVFTLIPYPAGQYANGTSYPAGSEKAVALAPWLIEPLGVPLPQPEKGNKFLDAAARLTRRMGNSSVPLVEARNFVWQTAVQFNRPAGYYTWLGIKDLKTFDKLTRVDRTITPLFDAVSDSEIGYQPRAIGRFGNEHGQWETYDQVTRFAIGKANPISVKNIPANKKLDFEAQRILGKLPNGLWVAVLVNNKGELQDSAPDGVGHFRFTRSTDGKIHPILTCLACHDKRAGANGLHTFVPWYRTLYNEPGNIGLSALRRKDLAGLEQEYLTQFEDLANIDKIVYAQALLRATGLTASTYAEVLYDTYRGWDRSVSMEDAAMEVGLPAEEFHRLLKQTMVKLGTLGDEINANWIQPPQLRQRVGRSQWTESYNLTQLALRGLPANGWPDSLRHKYPQKGAKK